MKRTTAAALCAVICLVMIFALSGCSTAAVAASPAAAAEEQITVSASAVVRLVPDKATVYFGVTSQEATAEEAQRKNSEAVNQVIAVLTGRGVEEKSIRTTNYSMYPQYDWSDGGEQRIIGYQVSTTMTVQDQDIGEVGALLSACVAAGINDVNSVSFLCSGYDEAYAEALTQAVAASKAKAEALAEAAGKKLGEPVTITEGWQDTSARYGRNADVAYAAKESGVVAGPVLQPGETEIMANVTVTYRMK